MTDQPKKMEEGAAEERKETLHSIRLGQSVYVGPIEMFRVPGGWVVFTIRGVCFVPYSEEFKS